jgi:hypothetical protein
MCHIGNLDFIELFKMTVRDVHFCDECEYAQWIRHKTFTIRVLTNVISKRRNIF